MDHFYQTQVPKIIRPEDRHVIIELGISYMEHNKKRLEKYPHRKFIHGQMWKTFIAQKDPRDIPHCIMCNIPKIECEKCEKTHKDYSFLSSDRRIQTAIRTCQICTNTTRPLIKCLGPLPTIRLIEGKYIPSTKYFLSRDFNRIPPYKRNNGQIVEMSEHTMTTLNLKLDSPCYNLRCHHLREAIDKSMHSGITLKDIVNRAARVHGPKTKRGTAEEIAYYYGMKQALEEEWKQTNQS